MLHIKKILHATDFSDCSASAFDLACALARDYTARLVVLHVKPPPFVPSGVMTPEPIEPPETAVELRHQLDAIQPADPTIAVEHVMLIGDEAEEIVHLAQEEGYDLIVIGTHGRTGLGRLLMGSVAEKVLRRAPCPVLTVKHPFPGAQPVPQVQVRETVAAG